VITLIARQDRLAKSWHVQNAAALAAAGRALTQRFGGQVPRPRGLKTPSAGLLRWREFAILDIVSMN